MNVESDRSSESNLLDNLSTTLPFKLPADLCEEQGEHSSWILPGLIGRATITELSGFAKDGKTTFLLELAKAVVSGETFLNVSPELSGPVIYMTEEGNTSFKVALEKREMLTEKRLAILQLPERELASTAWSTLMGDISRAVAEVGAALVIVDHIAAWLRLDAEQENDAAAVQGSLEQLRRITQAGTSLIFARHDRKSRGRVGESGRGSSAFSGFADDLLHLVDPRDHARPFDRYLSGRGRLIGAFENWTIRLSEHGFTVTSKRKTRLRDELSMLALEQVPTYGEPPILLGEIAKALSTSSTSSTLRRAMEELEANDLVMVHENLGATRKAKGYTRTAGDNLSP
jgi:hypothetical protein